MKEITIETNKVTIQQIISDDFILDNNIIIN